MAKRLLLINPVCGILSTGRICTDIAQEYEAKGWEVKIAYGRRKEVPDKYRKYGVRIGNMFGVYIHALISRIFGYHATGWCSKWATLRFVGWAEEWKPDVVWLHNLHDNYVNVEVLFDWIKRHEEYEVKWTHHDFWAVTGCCCYMGDCKGWRDGCKKCPSNYKSYRRGIFGGSEAREFKRKRSAFLGVKSMQLISPSQWVADTLRNSFLDVYSIKVVRNTIDTSIFKPTKSDFRERFGLVDKRMILGVSGFWEAPQKGFNDFMELSKILPGNAVIVLVGLTDKLMQKLPSNVLGLPRTNSASQLAEIYSAADVFFNPTHLDNFPTVNLEAAACGCAIITYDSGGTAETVADCRNAVILRGNERTPSGFLNAYSQLKKER